MSSKCKVPFLDSSINLLETFTTLPYLNSGTSSLISLGQLLTLASKGKVPSSVLMVVFCSSESTLA